MKKVTRTTITILLAVAAIVAGAGLPLHPAADSYLLLAMTKGGAGIGKSNAMPSWESTLSKQQMLDIIAYVRRMT